MTPNLDPPSAECCCAVDGPGAGTGGPGTGVGPGAGTGGTTPGGGLSTLGLLSRQCMTAGGLVGSSGSTDGLQSCSSPTFAPQCNAAPQGGCPPLVRDCVRASAWLGLPAPASDTTRLNMFPSESTCKSGRIRARDHPGVEDDERSLDSACRQICGGSLAACPCGQSEGWIVDLNPAGTATPPSPADSMADVLAERHGGTCAWCVETTLCVRWQRARGKTVDEAWSYREAPPSDAAAAERGFPALVRASGEWIRDLTKDWRF